jgi:hypothetical protein
LAIPLAPDYSFSGEELTKLESSIKISSGLNRTIKGSVVVWTYSKHKEESLWTSGKPIESITPELHPFTMGGHGSFWPLPLQREGPCSTVMWNVTIPEALLTNSWLSCIEEAISKEWKGLFWTLSKRYDLLCPSDYQPMLTYWTYRLDKKSCDWVLRVAGDASAEELPSSVTMRLVNPDEDKSVKEKLEWERVDVSPDSTQ